MSGMESAGSESVDELEALLRPYIDPLIERINVEEFSTVDFIEVMQTDPPTAAAYEEALRLWRENNPDMAKMVVHGQVIPQLLRRSRLVQWNGYAHGVDDPYAVPAWWRKTNLS